MLSKIRGTPNDRRYSHYNEVYIIHNCGVLSNDPLGVALLLDILGNLWMMFNFETPGPLLLKKTKSRLKQISPKNNNGQQRGATNKPSTNTAGKINEIPDASNAGSKATSKPSPCHGGDGRHSWRIFFRRFVDANNAGV